MKIKVPNIWTAVEVLDLLHWVIPKHPQAGHHRIKTVDGYELEAIAIVDYYDFSFNYDRVNTIEQEAEANMILHREVDLFIDHLRLTRK